MGFRDYKGWGIGIVGVRVHEVCVTRVRVLGL